VRGFLWSHLSEEVLEEFAQVHPLVQLAESLPYDREGWHVEGALGDMSGVRKSEVQRRGEKSTQPVRNLRERRRTAGLCIECGHPRDAKSKSYCPKHREADRLRAERKRGMRERLPDDRNGETLHFVITTKDPASEGVIYVDGYIQTGTYPLDDPREHLRGKLGEVFVKMGKAGKKTAAWIDQWAISFSCSLQLGADIDWLCGKFIGSRFDPFGPTNVKGIPKCSSPVDLICRYLKAKYGAPTIIGEELPMPSMIELPTFRVLDVRMEVLKHVRGEPKRIAGGVVALCGALDGELVDAAAESTCNDCRSKCSIGRVGEKDGAGKEIKLSHGVAPYEPQPMKNTEPLESIKRRRDGR
jgi:hypothetical protein